MDRVIRTRIVGANIPPAERALSLVLGGALAVAGGRKSKWLAVLGALIGVRGITGRSAIYRMRAVRKGLEVRRSVTVQATAREVYDLWRDLRNLPRFMTHVKRVDVRADGISHWVVKEAGLELEWDAEITEDTPGRRLRWRSLPGGDIFTEGMLDLREAPGGRGTVVEVKMHYKPPGGLLVAAAMQGFLRLVPRVQIGEELARLQQLLETGEIATGARSLSELSPDEKIPQATGLRYEKPASAGVTQ